MTTETKTFRTAKTRHGTTVLLDNPIRVEGGWDSYHMGPHGYAVRCFTPDA